MRLVPIVTLARLVQSTNAFEPILITLLGIAKFVKAAHKLKVPLPMLVTLSGMMMLARLSHTSNAQSPMEVTLFGMVMPVRSLQP